jgi:hypothetical protein
LGSRSLFLALGQPPETAEEMPMYTFDEGGGTASTGASVVDAPTERWTSVFHRTNGWLHAPPGSHFQRAGDMVELVGAVHRCGRVWYATSISKLGEDSE